jgi:hypothetical protein
MQALRIYEYLHAVPHAERTRPCSPASAASPSPSPRNSCHPRLNQASTILQPRSPTLQRQTAAPRRHEHGGQHAHPSEVTCIAAQRIRERLARADASRRDRQGRKPGPTRPARRYWPFAHPATTITRQPALSACKGTDTAGWRTPEEASWLPRAFRATDRPTAGSYPAIHEGDTRGAHHPLAHRPSRRCRRTTRHRPAALAEVTAPPVTPLQVNTAAQITPSPSPALGSSRYPRAFIEWKLSGSAGM